MVTCPICGTTPATTTWHGVTICTPCHQWQQTVDNKLSKIIIGLCAFITIMIIIIAT
jgi:hypothetical protein